MVEGLYANTGDLCPLPQIMNLKWKYKVRVFIDEAYSIGIVGRTGRGYFSYIFFLLYFDYRKSCHIIISLRTSSFQV